jgi:hypothetical protein
MCRPLGELIREAGLTACKFVSLTCEHCGKYRAIIAGTNGHRHPCPQCGGTAQCFTLAEGGTRRKLPCMESEAAFNYDDLDPLERSWARHRAES